MICSTGFLIYSRKVLIPQQRATARKAMPQRPGVQRPPVRPGVQPRPGVRRPGMRRPGVRRRPSPARTARRSLMSKFGEKAPGKKAASTPKVTPKKPTPLATPTARKPSKPIEEFVPITKLGKKPAKPKAKQLGGAFDKLKEISKGTKADEKGPDSAYKELSEDYKKEETKKKQEKKEITDEGKGKG